MSSLSPTHLTQSRSQRKPVRMKRKIAYAGAMSAVVLLASSSPVAAATVDPTAPGVLVDNAFVLICAALVIFMQAGFAMVEAGLTRAKNAAHMMLKNLLDFVVGATGFSLVGYHIAFSGGDYVGFTWLWAGPTEAAGVAPNLTMATHLVFNLGFAAAAATIVSGAVAERVQFKAYFIYAFVISALVYPIVVSWVWGGGWLTQLGFIDFAGSSVVHVTGGAAALMGALILGPRIGRFDTDGNSLPIPGHNIPLAILGVFILLIGWFGFNGGSVLAADLSVGWVIAMTALGAGAGGLGATVASWLTLKTPDVTLIGNGVLGGLVGVTAGAANISYFGAIIVGFVAGVIATNGVLLLDRVRIDDPVGAIPVHLMCGVWGTIAVGIFATPNATLGGDGPAGLLYGGTPSLLINQITGTVAIFGFSALATGTLFLIMKSLGVLRVTATEEMLGLDIAEHATPAYNDDYVDYTDVQTDERDEFDDFLEELTYVD